MSCNSNWRLSAISKAASAGKQRSFTLRNGTNFVGKTRNHEIRCPSMLCSRDHCKIVVEDDKIKVIDTSRNGTYVNDKRLNGEESALEHNDVISFGFNTSKIYDIKDRNAFIYRVMKDDIETIDLNDSDDDDIDDSVVIEIDSDSDELADEENDGESENSENELRNIDDDVLISSDDGASLQDEDTNDFDEASNGSGDFVVTDIILNHEDDDDDDDPNRTADKANEQANISGEVKRTANEATGDDGTSAQKQADDAEKAESSEDMGKEEVIMTVTTSSVKLSTAEYDELAEESRNDYKSRIDRVRELVNSKRQKNIALIAAQPLKKRRRTVTEREYELIISRRNDKRINPIALQKTIMSAESKQTLARDRADRLARVAQEQKDARKSATDTEETGTKKAIVMPRVKNTTVSRSEMLTMEMLTTTESRN